MHSNLRVIPTKSMTMRLTILEKQLIKRIKLPSKEENIQM